MRLKYNNKNNTIYNFDFINNFIIINKRTGYFAVTWLIADNNNNTKIIVPLYFITLFLKKNYYYEFQSFNNLILNILQLYSHITMYNNIVL